MNEYYNLHCNKCGNINKKHIININKQSDIPHYIKYRDEFNNYNFYVYEVYCDTCKNITDHYCVDSGISDIIYLLNKNGLITNSCCEGHLDNVLHKRAYISFNTIYHDRFDMSNELLKYWKLTGSYETIIEIRRDTPIEYLQEKRHLKDLEKYIINYIGG